MVFEDLQFLAEHGASLDFDKKRFELPLCDSDGQSSGGKIIGYVPSESIQVMVYDIRGGAMPDVKLDFSHKGRYLRVNICKNGRCKFYKDGREFYLSSGEMSMDYGLENDSSFIFEADDYLAVEIIMAIDSVVVEMPILAMLKKAVKDMHLPESDIKNSSLYFADISPQTARTVDEMLEYCAQEADSRLIVIKTSEIGHNLGTDLFDSKSKLRTFNTSSQTKIAEDIHKTLTEHYDQNTPASFFAEKYKVSDTSVKRYFKSVYGYGYKEYQQKVKMEKAAELLGDTSISVGEISGMVGYASPSKFSAAFKRRFGVVPLEYRRRKQS